MADIVSLKSHDAPRRPTLRLVLPAASGVTWSGTAPDATEEAGLTLHHSLEEAMAHGDPIVIGLQAPRTALAALISAGTDPEGAFGVWMERLTDLLRACRPHRRRICCVDMTVLTGDPAATAANIRARFGLDDSVDATAMAAAAGRMMQGPDIDPGSRIMADWLVDRHPEALALDAEVQAMIALKPKPGPAPLEMAGAALADRAALAEEVPLLRTSLDRLLADLDEATQAKARAQDKAEGMAARIAALGGERERLESAIAERDRQLSAERAGRAEAETRGIRLKEKTARLNARIGELERDRTALRDEVAALHRSTSWRLTAPLRGLRMGLARIIGR